MWKIGSLLFETSDAQPQRFWNCYYAASLAVALFPWRKKLSSVDLAKKKTNVYNVNLSKNLKNEKNKKADSKLLSCDIMAE